MKNDTFGDLNRLAEICLNLASITDRKAELGDQYRYLDDLGMGYRAFGSYLRSGVKAIADIQEMYACAKETTTIIKAGNEETKKFLNNILGDRNIYEVSNEEKKKIKAFIQELEEENRM